jgi:hypothetical protein
MPSDTYDRKARFRELVEANREISRELRATAERSRGESKELVRTTRALLERRASRKPDGQE